MTDQNEDTAHVAKLVENAQISMFTTMTADGKHVSRPMAVQDVEFDGDLWFFAYADSDLAEQVTANPEVNVSFSNSKSSEWTSISGRASVVQDRAKAEELWSPALKVWFEDGLDTPGLTLIKVAADSAQYWESPSSKVVQLIGAVRAMVTGDSEKFPGESKTVSL